MVLHTLETATKVEAPKYTQDQIKEILEEQGVSGIVDIIKKEERLTDEQIADFMRDHDPDYQVKPSEAGSVNSYFAKRIEYTEKKIEADVRDFRKAENKTDMTNIMSRNLLLKERRTKLRNMQRNWAEGENMGDVEDWFKEERKSGLEGVTKALNPNPAEENLGKDKFGSVNMKARHALEYAWQYMSAKSLLNSEIALKLAQSTPPAPPPM